LGTWQSIFSTFLYETFILTPLPLLPPPSTWFYDAVQVISENCLGLSPLSRNGSLRKSHPIFPKILLNFTTLVYLIEKVSKHIVNISFTKHTSLLKRTMYTTVHLKTVFLFIRTYQCAENLFLKNSANLKKNFSYTLFIFYYKWLPFMIFLTNLYIFYVSFYSIHIISSIL
jgi:hypothetical protein